MCSCCKICRLIWVNQVLLPFLDNFVRPLCTNKHCYAPGIFWGKKKKDIYVQLRNARILVLCNSPQAEAQPGPCRSWDWDPAGTLLTLASFVVWRANSEDGAVHLVHLNRGIEGEEKAGGFLSSRWSSSGGWAASGTGLWCAQLSSLLGIPLTVPLWPLLS